MSVEEIEPGLQYPSVSLDDALEYLADKSGSFICEVCQTDSWDVLHSTEKTVPALIVQSTEDFSTISTLPVVVVSCRNCSNTKLFMERPIYRYIKGKRSGNLARENESNG